MDKVSRIRTLIKSLSDEERAALLAELAAVPSEGRRRGDRDGLFRKVGSRYWWASHTDRDGRRHQMSTRCTDKQAARDFLARIRDDDERRKRGLPPTRTPKLADWLDEFLKARADKRSVDRDELSCGHLKRRLGHYRIGDLTAEIITNYRIERRMDPCGKFRKETAATRAEAERLARINQAAPERAIPRVSDGAVNRELACLRRALNVAVERGILAESPMRRVELLREAPARQPVLTDADEKALFEALAPWARPILRFMLTVGCRRNEAINLRWRDVDLPAREFTIKDSKSGASRRVPLSMSLAEMLTGLQGLPDAPVFRGLGGRHGDPEGKVHAVEPDSLSHEFQRAAKAIGRGDLRLHDLRHVCASRLHRAGASPMAVQDVLGHQSPKTTRGYIHVEQAELRSFIDAADVTAHPASGATTSTSKQ